MCLTVLGSTAPLWSAILQRYKTLQPHQLEPTRLKNNNEMRSKIWIQLEGREINNGEKRKNFTKYLMYTH